MNLYYISLLRVHKSCYVVNLCTVMYFNLCIMFGTGTLFSCCSLVLIYYLVVVVRIGSTLVPLLDGLIGASEVCYAKNLCLNYFC